MGSPTASHSLLSICSCCRVSPPMTWSPQDMPPGHGFLIPSRYSLYRLFSFLIICWPPSLSVHFESGMFRGYLLSLMAYPTHPDLGLSLIIVSGLQDFQPGSSSTFMPDKNLSSASGPNLPCYRDGYSHSTLGALTLPPLLAFMLLITLTLEWPLTDPNQLASASPRPPGLLGPSRPSAPAEL